MIREDGNGGFPWVPALLALSMGAGGIIQLAREYIQEKRWYKEEYPVIVERCLALNGGDREGLARQLCVGDDLKPKYFCTPHHWSFFMSGYHPSPERVSRVLGELERESD